MDVDSEGGGRWVLNDDDVAWCDSVEALLAALGEGRVDIEVGGLEQPGPVLQVLAEAAPRLQSLSLCGCNLDATALVQLGGALALSQIRGIGVSNNPGIDMQSWARFWGSLPRSILKWDFGDDELTDEALPVLVQAVGRGSAVRELLLDGNDFADIGPLLPAVSAVSGLCELDVGDNDLDDAQIRALAAVLPGSCLATLVLGRNPITDAGAVALAAALPQTRLGALYLDSTQVGDATLDALAGVLHCTQLEELHIDETRVSDAGVLRLLRALPASKLRLLDAADSGLSEETVAAIRAVLPEDVDH